MSEIVTPEILYSQQAGIIGALESLASRLDGELKTRPVTVRQEADAALVAALDQLNAGVRELRELVAKPLAPPEVNVAAPNLEPVQEAVAHLAELVSALPEQIGKRMNIRIAAGGVASPTSAVQIKDTVSATIDPATQPTLQGIRDRLDSMETILSGKGSEATLASVKTNLDDLKLLVDTVEAKLQSLIDATPALSLSARMFARQPTTGWRIWLDTVGSAHTNGTKYLFIAEALASDIAGTGAHRGIRIALDANGNPLGEVEENTAFNWSTRLTVSTGWS